MVSNWQPGQFFIDLGHGKIGGSRIVTELAGAPLAFSGSDGRWLVTSNSATGYLQLWDLGEPAAPRPDRRMPGRGAVFSWNGVAWPESWLSIQLWDIDMPDTAPISLQPSNSFLVDAISARGHAGLRTRGQYRLGAGRWPTWKSIRSLAADVISDHLQPRWGMVGCCIWINRCTLGTCVDLISPQRSSRAPMYFEALPGCKWPATADRGYAGRLRTWRRRT